jgi:ribosome biogenesis SPOUT family RNA methylase Rps3
MEPEMGAWSTLEYIAISNEVSATGGTFYLSSLQPALAASLPPGLQKQLEEGKFVATTKDVETISGVPKERVCLLDPQATQELTPEDGEIFDWFVFGGILGWWDPFRA